MSVPWPTELQDTINTDSFQYQIGDTAIRSDMDVGPAKVRRRYTRSVDKIQMAFNLNQTDWDFFYEFFNTTLNGGVTPFTYYNPLSGETETWRAVSPPSVRPFGYQTYVVSMQVERLP